MGASLLALAKSIYYPFLHECSKKMFLQRGQLQEMRNWCKASIRSKSVKNTELIESIECFLFVLFLDIPDSCNKTTHWSVISVAKKEKGKQTDQLKNKGKRFQAIQQPTNHDTIDSHAIAVICFVKSASILFKYFCCNGERLYYFSHEKRTKSRKMSPETQVTADRLAQMFRVSHTADYYN